MRSVFTNDGAQHSTVDVTDFALNTNSSVENMPKPTIMHEIVSCSSTSSSSSSSTSSTSSSSSDSSPDGDDDSVFNSSSSESGGMTFVKKHGHIPSYRPYDFRKEISFCVWSSRAGFGEQHVKSPMFARKKCAKVFELAHQHDVTIVLEAHADRGDIVQLHATIHNTHHVAFNSKGSKLAGGIVVFIKMALLRTVSSLQAKVIVPGRALQLHFLSPFGALTIAGLHLVPAWSPGLKKRVLAKVFNSFLPPDVASGFLLADFNVTVTGDITFDSTALLPRRRRDLISAYFDALFHRFFKLKQPNYTRFGAGIYLRIDCIYTNMRTSTILDLKPIVRVSRKLKPSERAPASDHVPVFVVFKNQVYNPRKAFLVWVAKRPELIGFLQKCGDFRWWFVWRRLRSTLGSESLYLTCG